jgi:hypothetical protein
MSFFRQPRPLGQANITELEPKARTPVLQSISGFLTLPKSYLKTFSDSHLFQSVALIKISLAHCLYSTINGRKVGLPRNFCMLRICESLLLRGRLSLSLLMARKSSLQSATVSRQSTPWAINAASMQHFPQSLTRTRSILCSTPNRVNILKRTELTK